MVDTTAKIGLKKPIVNSEINWGVRLNETIDILDDSILGSNLSGAGSVSIINDGSGNITVTGTDSEVATNLNIVSVSGHLQSEIDTIDSNVDLQEAYDNGDGVITTTAGKPLSLQGTGELTAVSGTFTGDVGIGTTSPSSELEVVGYIVSKGTKWTSQTSAADNSWFGVTYGNGLFVTVATTGSSNRIMTSPDGINWTTRITPVDNKWVSVIYGNGLFVAVSSTGSGDQVMTSPDGINWTIRTTPVDNIWSGMTYGNDIFVAVAITGNFDRVMTSPGGITWTIRDTPVDNSWQSVVYGNGLFVAVSQSGPGNRVMTSPDGITWTIQTSAADNGWFGVTYGNGLFVAVAKTGTGNRVMTSPDGINWTSRTSAADNDWRSIAYGNGLFVAVAQSGSSNRVMTSPDGINWTIRVSAADNVWFGITYGNGLFVAVASDGSGNRVMISGKTELNEISTNNIFQGGMEVRRDLNVTGDLTISGSGAFSGDITAASGTFTSAPDVSGDYLVTQSQLDAIDSNVTLQEAYDNGDGVVVTTAGKPLDLQGTGELTAISGTFSGDVGIGTLIPTSELEVVGDIVSKGTKWSLQTSAEDNTWYSVTYGNGIFVAVSADGSNDRVMTSPDGINWTIRTGAPDRTWFGVTYGNGLFVAVAMLGDFDRVMTSPDGITWTSRTASVDNNWSSVVYGNGLFVAVAQNGSPNQVMTSPDGINWTTRASVADNKWRYVTYGNGLFVSVAKTGSGDRVMTSPDGINWTIRASAANNDWVAVIYGNGLFVATSNTGTGDRVMTSPDGFNWTLRDSAADNDWRSVTYGNGLFVAVASDGVGDGVMTSPDGINWTSRITPTTNSWTAVTYGNGVFVAIAGSGSGNRVMTSGKTELNEISTNNIFQGGMEVRRDLNVTGDLTISGNAAFSGGITATSGTFTSAPDVSGDSLVTKSQIDNVQTQIDGIDSSVTLQEAYDNGNGIISATGDKPFQITGSGVVTKEFTVGQTLFEVASSQIFNITQFKAGSGFATFDISAAPTDETSDASIRLFRNTETTGIKNFNLLAGEPGDSSTKVKLSVSTTGERSFFDGGGNYAFGHQNPSVMLDVVGSGIFTGGLQVDGATVNLGNLPTASAGLNSGDLWKDISADYTLKVTP